MTLPTQEFCLDELLVVPDLHDVTVNVYVLSTRVRWLSWPRSCPATV